MRTQSFDKKSDNSIHFDDNEPLISKQDPEHSSGHKEIPPISLDHIFDRIGLGYYQLRLIFILGLVAAAEGAQIVVVMLCLTIQQNQWKYSDTVQSFVISLNFIGVVIGGGISGFFADKYGRLKPMLVSLSLITFLNLVSGFAEDIAFFGLVRFLVGLFLGFFAPLGLTMVVENMPKEHRGKLLIIAFSFLFIGQLMACFLAFLTVEDLVTGDWKALIYWSTALLIAALVVNFMYLDESVRYEIVMGEFNKAFKLLNKIIKANKEETMQELSEEDKGGLQSWAKQLSEEVTDNEIASVSALFKGQYKPITIIIWFGYFVNSFIYYGIVLILPFILTRISETNGEISESSIKNTSDLASIAVSVLVETLFAIIAFTFVDTKSIGRRELLIIFYALTGLTCFAGLIYISRTLFVVWVTIAKIFINVCFVYFYLFTVEIYPTKYRATGIGVATAVGKVATIIMPWICYKLAGIYLFLPFGLFGVLTVLAALATHRLKIDTQGIELK